MREGLMDDVGYHGIDDEIEFAEKYCSKCLHEKEDGTCGLNGWSCNGEDFEEYGGNENV